MSIHDKTAATEVLSWLINTPSPTPPGDSVAVAEHISQFMKRFGFETSLVASSEAPEKTSVVATLDSGVPGPTVMLHAHIDTVPVGAGQAWEGDPFTMRREGDNLVGLGACDDKGQMAAMIVAACRVAESNTLSAGKLMVVGAADEEAAGDYGTGYLLKHGYFDELDFAVIGEQTHNRMALAHKGTYRTKLAIHGRSVHATNPDRGINAVQAMFRAGVALEQYHSALLERPHPLVGTPTCSVNIVHGGQAANLVADYCEAWIDRRRVPGETTEDITAELHDVVSTALEGSSVKWELPETYAMPAFEERKRNEFTDTMAKVISEIAGGSEDPVGYLPGSDAKFFPRLTHVTTVVFGAGSYEQAHAENEFVSAFELEQAADILEQLVPRVVSAKS